MQEREKIACKRVLNHAVQLRSKHKEIDLLHAQREEEAHRQVINAETETQMTEHILQYENQIVKLNDTNKHLVSSYLPSILSC